MASTAVDASSSIDTERENLRHLISTPAPNIHDIRSTLTTIDRQPSVPDLPYDATLEHNGKRSLANIGLQAFCLGIALGIGLMLSAQLAQQHNLLWRAFAFLTCLALFHFLEYWTTARFNLPATRSNSFLLFTNGTAYNIAYSLAFTEILVSVFFFDGYAHWLTNTWSRSAGAILVCLGQLIRSVAMAQAGTNFNHIPQKTRKDGHVLVTSGIYRWLRHPSYFGFFWWALGSQLLVGNKVCTVGYALVLWRFFKRRIIAEERTLVEFFGDDYLSFKSSTSTGIPFIR